MLSVSSAHGSSGHVFHVHSDAVSIIKQYQYDRAREPRSYSSIYSSIYFVRGDDVDWISRPRSKRNWRWNRTSTASC